MIKNSFRVNLGRKVLGTILFLAVLLAAMPVSAFAAATDAELKIFESYEVSSVNPELIKVNLFDYWVDGNQDTPDNIGYDTIAQNINNDFGAYVGINYDADNNRPHILHFVKSPSTKVGPESKYTGNESPGTGLVLKSLGEDDYPVAVKATNLKDANGNPIVHPHPDMPAFESLAYLFNPAIAHNGKASYTDVKGLFQLDSDGYYYYNSMLESTSSNLVNNDLFKGAYASANYAYFDGDVTGNRFRLYNNWGVTHGNGIYAEPGATGVIMSGQFYPFNSPAEVYETNADGTLMTDAAGKLVPKNYACTHENINHYLGLSMEVPFVQTVNGKTGNGEDTVFYFSGDDDMWLFIDGVLVGDIGGIHDATAMEINFAQGTVKVNKGSGSGYEGAATYYLDELFAEAGHITTEFKGHTFKDLSHHVIRMFYMERGNTASNLGIKFNLQTVPVSTLKKIDQDGNAVEGAVYEIYKATRDANTKEYTIADNMPLFTGRTDKEGLIHLLKDGRPISFHEMEGDYFILHEKETPEGYRSVGDIHLKKYTLEDGVVTLVADPESPTGNKWSTGSYATLQELTNSNSNDIYLRSADGGKGEQIVKDNVLTKGGTLFAVVMKWNNPSLDPRNASDAQLQDHHNWLPVYGNHETGYHVVKPADNTEAAYNEAVKTAVKNTKYLFKIGASGRYEVMIEDMPGDILHYLHTRESGNNEYPIRYTVFYGWTDVDSLDKLDEATACARLYSDHFSRSFSATFLALNTQYSLHVIKTDESGTPLGGVEFSLYKQDQVEQVNGKWVVKDSEWDKPYARQITGSNGKLSFGKEIGKYIKNGYYYMAETNAPEGYVLREELVRIIVDDTNIYVDAGVENDGVKVRRSVGTLVETMHEFGVNNDLDETLFNIRVTPQLQFGSTIDPNNWVSQSPIYHLNHTFEGAHGYVATPGTNTPANDYITDVGLSRLVIQQCSDHISDSPSSYKENLGNRDISNLFTREATILISNEKHRAGAYIDGTKVLEGRYLSRGEFSFQIEAFDPSDAPLPAETIVKNAANGSFSFGPIDFAYGSQSNSPYIYLIREIPDGNKDVVYDDTYWIAKVYVSYNNAEKKMDTSVVYEHYNANGDAIGEIDPRLATFVNVWKPDVPPTGDNANLALWIGMLALSAIGIMMLFRKARREY